MRVLTVAALLTLSCAMPLGAQETVLAAAQDLKGLSIEELMQIDVTSVSRRSELFFDASSAVSVITTEELRRSGVTSLPEALRLINSLHVGRQSQSTWAISARGFNSATADKMLVLIDGRSVYTPLFSGVFWDAQDVLLEDVDRIEVIRGPGATVWGANAVNGVINVITKPALDTQGGLVTAGAGNEERGFGAVRWGGAVGERGHYRVYGKYANRDGLDALDGRDLGNDMWMGQGGFRSDWKAAGDGGAVTFQGDVYTGRIGEPGVDDADVDGGNLLGRWSRRSSERKGLELQVYWDRTHRMLPTVFEEHRDTWDVDFQQDLPLGGRQNVIWGLGYRHTRDRTQSLGQVAFVPDRRAQDLWSGFVQDEISLLDRRLRVTLGTKLEHNEWTGLEVQPSARFSLTLSEKRMLWGAVSRAVRTPSRLDEDVILFFRQFPGVAAFVGNPHFDSEKLLAWELGHRMQLGPELILDNAVFYNVYDDLRSLEPPAIGIPVTFGNLANAETWGLETRINWQPLPWWSWHLAYAWLDGHVSVDPGSRAQPQPQGNDPENRVLLRSMMDLPGDVELDGWLRWIDRLPAPEVPSYFELDLHLGWRPRPPLELALIGRNLLHGAHEEFGPPGPAREVVERSVYGRVTWAF